MAWNDLTIAQRSQWMNFFRHQGIGDLSRMRELYDVTHPSVSSQFSSQVAPMYSEGGKIHIKPSRKGTFTAAATKHGMGVQAFASKVLANKDNYSPKMVKKAVFAKNFAHSLGGNLFPLGGPTKEEIQRIADNLRLIKDTESLADRQRYAESAYNDSAYNAGSEARGAYQITPALLNEYTDRTGLTGELDSLDFNRQVRDWYMNERLPEFEVYRMGTPTDSVKLGRKYAAFNAGPGKVRKALINAKANNVDINQGFDWLGYLPQETQDYVNFVVRGKDIPKTSKTQEALEKTKRKKGIKSFGGIIF